MTSPTAHPLGAVMAIVERALTDPSFRGALIYFPERVAQEYGLNETEARAISTADLSALDLDDESLAKANIVFDLHDLHSGE
jgi:hypothetical protein